MTDGAFVIAAMVYGILVGFMAGQLVSTERARAARQSAPQPAAPLPRTSATPEPPTGLIRGGKWVVSEWTSGRGS